MEQKACDGKINIFNMRHWGNEDLHKNNDIKIMHKIKK